MSMRPAAEVLGSLGNRLHKRRCQLRKNNIVVVEQSCGCVVAVARDHAELRPFCVPVNGLRWKSVLWECLASVELEDRRGPICTRDFQGVSAFKAAQVGEDPGSATNCIDVTQQDCRSAFSRRRGAVVPSGRRGRAIGWYFERSIDS